MTEVLLFGVGVILIAIAYITLRITIRLIAAVTDLEFVARKSETSIGATLSVWLIFIAFTGLLSGLSIYFAIAVFGKALS